LNKGKFVFFVAFVLQAYCYIPSARAQIDVLDSLRNVVQELAADSSKTYDRSRRLLSAYLYQAKSNNSPEDIIYAYQQLASVNYLSGNINQALKFYKLYVLELENLTEFEEYKDQQFEINLYENEIRALNLRIKELEAEVALLKEDKQNTYEQNLIIYIGLRVMLGIAILLLLGWGYQKLFGKKKPKLETESESSKKAELAAILNKTKSELVAAETELNLADILVQKNIVRPEDYLEANRSLRNKFLFSQSKGLTSGAGLFLHTTKNLTLIVVFSSPSSGASGGLLCSQVYQQLDQIVKQLGITSPALVLEKLEENLAGVFPAGVPFTGGLSCAVCLYDNSAQSLMYSGANFDLFEVSRSGQNWHIGSIRPVLEEGSNATYSNEVIQLSKGMGFYLCTSSYWLQNGGHEFRPLGKESFEKTVLSTWQQPVEEQKLVLSKIYNEWLGGNEQDSDILIFGFLL